MSAKFPKEFYLRVVIYPDEDRFIAHCLEMDLIGIGSTPRKAFADLHDHVRMQVSFAHQQGNPAMLWHPAPKWLFNKAEKLTKERVTGITRSRKYNLAQLPYPEDVPALTACYA